MASLKPKISQVFDSILKEIRNTTHTTVLRFRQPLPHPSHEYSPQPWVLPSDQSPAHFANRPVAMTNPSSALTLIYLLRIILICLGLTLCLLLTTKIPTTWIMRLLSSQPKMSTHHVGLTSRPSALNSHLFSKPSIGIN